MRAVRMWSGDEPPLGPGEPSLIGAQVGPLTIVGYHPVWAAWAAPATSADVGQDRAVYLAEHTVLKTRRAVKIAPSQLTHNPLALRRFVHDARAAARLRHRNLIQLHDVGQLA